MCHLLLNATVIGPSNEEGYLGATFMGSSPPTEARAGRRAPSQQEGTGGLRLLLASSTEGGSTGLWPAAGPAADFWVKRELWDARGKVGSTKAPPILNRRPWSAGQVCGCPRAIPAHAVPAEAPPQLGSDRLSLGITRSLETQGALFGAMSP